MSKERLQALGEELRSLRTDAGWSGSELAGRAGVSQPSVSRVENGLRVASVDSLARIIDALPVTAELAQRLRSTAQEIYASSAERRADAGVSFAADTVRKLERGATSIQGFQPAAIPRHLRTAQYAQAASTRAIADSAPFGEARRQFHFVVTEGALRTWPGSGAVMPAQLNHLLSVIDLPNVRLGLVPWSRELPVMPLHGFTVYDGAAVSVETFTAEMAITEPDDVRTYADAFAALDAIAEYGPDARELLDSVRRDFQEANGIIQQER